MKTLANDILTAFIAFGGAKPIILIEITTNSGIRYFSDQHVLVGSVGYEGRVLTWGRMSMELALGEDSIREGNVPIKLSNQEPKISDDISPGDAVSIFIWNVGVAAGSKFKIFEGTVNDDIIAGYSEFSFTCTDVSAKYNKLMGDKLTDDVWSGANPDPNDIGKVQPIVYGSNKNVRCLAVEAGAASTLSQDHTDSQTTFNVTDTTRFPSTGQAVIGNEVISYTGKTATTLTGVTRGESAGGDATTHSQGDGIFENVATVKYMASSRIAKALTNARIVPWGSPIEEAVSVDNFATYAVNDGGFATVELDSLPQIRREINIAVTQQPDQPVTSTGTHIHTGAVTGNSQVNINADGINSRNGVSEADAAKAFDQNSDTFAPLVDGSSAHLGLDFSYAAFDGLTIKKATAVIHHQAASGGWTTYNVDLASVSYAQALASSAVPGVIQKFEVSALVNETDWSNLDGLRVIATDAGGVSVRLYELHWEIEYAPAVTINTHAADAISTSPRTDDVIIGGDSVAASLGGFLIADVDGEPDVAGHWTGSGTDLIEKPVDIIHHILETFTNGPVAHANIDLTGSFADAETNHPLLDKFGFVITQQIWVNELLTYLAQQFFCRFVWEAGIAKLNRIKITAGSTNDKSIDTDWDSAKRNNKLAVKENRWGKDRVWNDITVNYDLDMVASDGKWFDPDAYQQNTQDEDATSISNNGRQARVFDAFAVGDNSTMADDLRDKLLAFYKDNRKWVSFPSWTKLIDLERGDEIDITSDQLGLSAFDAQVVNVEIEMPKRGQSIIPIITALEI